MALVKKYKWKYIYKIIYKKDDWKSEVKWPYCLQSGASIVSVNRLPTTNQNPLFLKLVQQQAGENTEDCEALGAQGEWLTKVISTFSVRNQGTELKVCNSEWA